MKNELLKGLTFVTFVFFPFINGFGQLQSGNLINHFTPSNTVGFNVDESISVDKYTGKLLTGFKLISFNDKNRGLEHNIALNFNGGSGHKINTKAGIVGLDWSLDIGGVIYREVIDVPDDKADGYSQSPVISDFYNTYDTSVLKSFLHNQLDGQMDVYYYSAGSRSGKFVIGKNGQVITIPRDNVTIAVIPKSTTFSPSGYMDSCNTNKFSITLPDGTVYLYNSFDCKQLFYDDNNNSTYSSTSTNTWYLNEIISPFAKESITLGYESQLNTAIDDGDSYVMDVNLLNRDPTDPAFSDEVINACRSTINQNGHLRTFHPSFINYPNGISINFVYDNFQRLDDKNEKALREIQVSHSGNLIYGYKLDYTYTNRIWDNLMTHVDYPNTPYLDYTSNPTMAGFIPENRSLLLTGFNKFSGTDNLPGYKFEYDETCLVRRGADRASDLLGYYNGKLNEDILIRVEALGASTALGQGPPSGPPHGMRDLYLGGTRKSVLEYAKAKSLKKIILPTGGYHSIEYELNSYDQVSSTIGFQMSFVEPDKLPGLRVKKIKTFDGIANTSTKEYSYNTTAGTSTGVLASDIKYSILFNQTIQFGPRMAKNLPCAAATFANTFAPLGFNAEYFAYVYRSSIPFNKVHLTSGSIVGYGAVTEYIGTSVNYLTKTVSNYSTPNNFPSSGTPSLFPFPFDYNKYFATGLPIKETSYNNSNTITKETEYDNQLVVEDYDQDVNFRNIKVGILHEPIVDINSFKYDFFYPISGYLKTNSMNTKRHLSTGIVVKNINYTYILYNGFKFLKEKKYRDSRNELITERYFYVFEYNISGAINTLKTLNMGYFPIVTETWKGDPPFMNLISSSASNLKVLPDNSVKQDEIYKLSTSTPISASTWGTFNNTQILQHPTMFTKLSKYDLYDDLGNPIQESSNGKINSQLWGYEKQKQIAEIVNAKVEDVFFTSFEDGCDLGGWTLVGLPQINSSGVTGGKSLSISSNKSIKKMGLLISKEYSLSVWVNGGVPTITTKINGVSGAVYTVVTPIASEIHNGWQLYKADLSNCVEVSLSSSSLIKIDELRLVPKGAAMTTSTFHPLFGVTSVCDASNTIIYTEYDAFGRVILTRDADMNILKKYEYITQEQQ